MNTDISAGEWAVDSGGGGGWQLGVGARCAVYTVYAPILLAPGTMLIKCSDFQRSLLARSISDPSVLATRGAYVFIFSLCCLLSVCNVFTTPRAGPQSRPLPLVLFQIMIMIYYVVNEYSNFVCNQYRFYLSVHS